MKTALPRIFVTLLLTSFFSAKAQFKQIAAGPQFEEPATGNARLLQMSNGNTVFVHFTTKEGYNIRVYDATHTEKVVANYAPAYERFNVPPKESAYSFYTPNHEIVRGFFELNNECVLFIEEADKKKTALYRVTLDLTTGKPKEEKELFVLKKEGRFRVVKSPVGEGYSILILGTIANADKSAGGPQVYLYDKLHKEINKAVCISPESDKEHEILDYQDMAMTGTGSVCLFFTAYSGKYGAPGTCYMMVLGKSGAPGFQKLNLPPDLLYREIYANYNPVSDKIICLAVTEIKKESGDFNLYMNIIDPAAKTAKDIKGFLPGDQVNEAYKSTFDKKKDYSGLPQQIAVNNDGSFSIIYEEVGSLSQGDGGGYGRKDTKLGKMVVVTLDKDGKWKSSYLVPKAHWILFTSLYAFYYRLQSADLVELFRGNQYKSFNYLSTKGGSYLFINDSERNNEVKNDKLVEIQGMENCDAFSYKLGGADIIPRRDYFFGQPAKGHALALFQASDYDSQTGVYVTLKLVKESARDNQVTLVWMQMQ